MLRVSSVMIALLFSCFIYSQEKDNTTKYSPSFGFNVGLNYSALYNSNQTEELEIFNAPGFRLGVLANFPISERWSISPKSELSFNYSNIIQDNVQYRVDPNNIDFMIHFKHRFKGYNNKVTPYFYFGPNLRTPMAREQDFLALDTRLSLAFDFAFGVDIELKEFIISPELRFSGGLTDIRTNPEGKMLRGSNTALVINFTSK
jgi:hypothetical protein